MSVDDKLRSAVDRRDDTRYDVCGVPTNPRNTCVVLQGEKPPEEVLFVCEDKVIHYVPEGS